MSAYENFRLAVLLDSPKCLLIGVEEVLDDSFTVENVYLIGIFSILIFILSHAELQVLYLIDQGFEKTILRLS